MMKRTIQLAAMALLCVLGQAASSLAEDATLKTGEKQDTLLYVRTIPPGAKVLLDGKELGTSDGVFHVEPGVGKVLVELKGHPANSKQVNIRANSITRIELMLESQAQVEGGHSITNPPPFTIQQVPFTIGPNFFQKGDLINITEVKASSPNPKKGDKVNVKGYYMLASASKASLLLSVTATKGSGHSKIRREQTKQITRGQGDFEFSETMPFNGYLEVAFYPVPAGEAFGGLYVGTAKQMEEIKSWDVKAWYTNHNAREPAHSNVEDDVTEVQVVSPDTPTKPAAHDTVADDTIVEGIGWKGVRVGGSREDLIKALGKPDNDPSSDWLKWSDKHIDCWFQKGAIAVFEVRFNPGFKGALANGVKLGSSGSEMLKIYGEPEHMVDQGNGARMYEYSKKGILFWTTQGSITQIVLFKPYSPAGNTESVTNNDHADAKKKAIASAEAWLALVDKGQYGQSWETAAEAFKKGVSKANWVNSLTGGRKPLGDVKSRKLMSQQFTKTLPGAPDGEYVILQYETSFANKASAVETITPMLDNGPWKVSGYYIK
jgi:hypothetical protein